MIYSVEATQHTSTPNKNMVNAKCQSSDHRTEQNRIYYAFRHVRDDHNTVLLFCLMICSVEATQHTGTPNKIMVNAKCVV